MVAVKSLAQQGFTLELKLTQTLRVAGSTIECRWRRLDTAVLFLGVYKSQISK